MGERSWLSCSERYRSFERVPRLCGMVPVSCSNTRSEKQVRGRVRDHVWQVHYYG